MSAADLMTKLSFETTTFQKKQRSSGNHKLSDQSQMGSIFCSGYALSGKTFSEHLHLSAEPQHDDVIKWKHFQHWWSFVRGIHWSPVNSPHKSQWSGTLKFSLICTWTNGWVNNRDTGDLRCHHAHYDVTVMNKWSPQVRTHCQLCMATPHDWWILHTKGQYCGKVLHGISLHVSDTWQQPMFFVFI